MDVKTKVRELLQPYLTEDHYFIVDIQVSSSRNGSKVIVLLDSDTGITIDECATISRQLGKQLEDLPIFNDETFTLEVSSPGADQPLVLLRQYQKNVGRNVSVLLQNGQIKKGKLKDVGKDHIVIAETATKKSRGPLSRNAESTGNQKNVILPELIEIELSSIKKTTIELLF